VEFISTGHVTLHWSRLIVGGFGLLLAAHTAVTWVLLQVLGLWKAEQRQSTGGVGETLPFPLPSSTTEGHHESRPA
jgi:hypothetical protein